MAHFSTEPLLTEITSFLDETGMGVSYFGKIASGNSELVSRLKRGGRVWPETEERVREFIRQYRAGAAANSEAAE